MCIRDRGKGTGYERWAKKYNLKAMAQTLILLQEKDLLNEDDLNPVSYTHLDVYKRQGQQHIRQRHHQ